jgi:hypothetical protein
MNVNELLHIVALQLRALGRMILRRTGESIDITRWEEP